MSDRVALTEHNKTLHDYCDRVRNFLMGLSQKPYPVSDWRIDVFVAGSTAHTAYAAMSERPALHKHHSSNSVVRTARSPTQRAQHGPVAGPRSRLGPRVPSHARNVNKMTAQRTVLPRNKSKTLLRKNQSETALHRRNRSSADIVALRRTMEDEEDEDEEEEGGEEETEEETEEIRRLEKKREGEKEDDDEEGAAGVASKSATTTSNTTPSTTQPPTKTSNQQQQTSKVPNNLQKSTRFVLGDATFESSKSTTPSDNTKTSTPFSQQPEASTTSSSTPRAQDWNDLYSKQHKTLSKSPLNPTIAASAMNLQASLERDRQRQMQPTYAYPPSMWKDHKMREIIPHLTNPDPEETEYYSKYCARMTRNVDKKLDNISCVNNPLFRSLDRIGADPVAAQLAEHKVKEVPKPVKTGLARFFGGLGAAQKPVAVPEVDTKERDLRIKAFKRDLEIMQNLNPGFVKEMRAASALKDV